MKKIIDVKSTVPNEDWKNDQQTEHNLKLYISENWKLVEILECMKWDFGDYHWSLRTLAVCLKKLVIAYINHETSVDCVKETVEKETNGPGKPLGYQTTYQKLRLRYLFSYLVTLYTLRYLTLTQKELQSDSRQEKEEKTTFNRRGPIADFIYWRSR